MKKFSRFMVSAIFVLLIVSLAWADVVIDEANFPDEEFRRYVSVKLDTDM